MTRGGFRLSIRFVSAHAPSRAAWFDGKIVAFLLLKDRAGRKRDEAVPQGGCISRRFP
jgi:hypothetical protein